MLYIIGLGLGDEKDISLRGLEAVQNSKKVFIEAYTSLLFVGLSSDGLSALEKLYGKSITVADREMVEEKADGILLEATSSDGAFLVVGDPFGATTHTDLVVRAKKLGVDVKVVLNASVMNAIGVYNSTDMGRRFPFHSSPILGGLIVSMRRFKEIESWGCILSAC